MKAPDSNKPAGTAATPSPTRAESPIYTASNPNRELRQCEIITNLTEYTIERRDGLPEVLAAKLPYVLALSQDCDLLRDFDARSQQENASGVRNVLLYELEPAASARGKIGGRDIWKRIAQNKDDRYHFFEAVPPSQDLIGEGLPELVADFRQFFTLNPAEVYHQLSIQGPEGAKRRCRLVEPYREHGQSRAAFYLLRVGLPLDHQQGQPQPPPLALPHLSQKPPQG